jgi:tetratricopeptide (TPR) repeat protein
VANPTTESKVHVDDKKNRAKAGAAELRLSNYLGILRDDPFDAEALEGLRALIALPEGEERRARLGDNPVRLIEKARQGHEERAELVAVAHLLEAEAKLVSDDAPFAGKLWKELGRVRAESLLEPEAAHEAYEQAQKLLPGDVEVEESIRRLEQESKNWKKLIKRFEEEAAAASEPRLRAALLTDIAALTWQHKKKGRDQDTEKLLREAASTDPGFTRATALLEHTLRERGALGPLADLLLDAAERATTPKAQIALYARAGRTIARDLKEPARAAACFERVNDLSPGHADAMAFLSEHFGKQERWDDLAALYEQTLASRPEPDVEQAILLQIGMTHYRMRGRADAAEPFFARLRKLDPAHPAMLDFYRELFTESGRQDEWLAVLADAQRVATTDAQRAELALLAGRAALNRPELRDKAIESFRLAQRLDPKNRGVTAALRELYLKAEKWNALADVIKSEIEATPDADKQVKIGLLRELHAIYRDRLHMDGMVIGTLGRILKLSPGDQDALTELATKYESSGRFNELISILTERAEALTDPTEKVDGYLRVARMWIERFQNFNQATGPFEKVLEIDPNNREALSQLRGIYEKKRAWKQLYEVLRRERTVASDPTARLVSTIELAKLAADRLQSYAEAIGLWKEALAIDPAAPGAIEALQKLAERDRDYATLAELLEREVERAAGNEDKVRALQKLAALRAEQLQDVEGALASWRRILEIEPRHGRALRAVRDSLLAARDFDGLTALYARANDDEGLLDVLSSEADRVEDPKAKVALSFRAADVLEQRIKEPLRAVRSYERVLSVDANNQRAASALSLVYEQEEKWGRLRAMLEIMLRGATDTGDRVRLLSRLRELCLQHLREGDAALVYAAEAYRLAPDEVAVREALEKAAAAAAGWDTVVELYSQRAREAGEDSAIELRRRAAAIALSNLGKPAIAAEQLRFVLAQRPDDADVMATLERIYRGAQDVMALHTLLEHRLSHVPDEGIRVATLRELAEIEENVGGDANGAAARLRALTELRADDRDALAGLDRLALAAERWEELADVLERRIAIETDNTQQIELGSRLGSVFLDKLEQPERAISAFEGVLEREGAHAGAISALERIAEQREELGSRIRPTLEQVYERTGRYDKLLKLLEKRLKGEKNEQETRRLRLRIAEISAGELGDAAGAYGALEAAFFEQPSDRDLWDKLADAAEAAGQQRALGGAYTTAIEASDIGEDARIELAIRAAKLFDEVLGLPEDAEPLHKRVLAADAQNERSFIALKELYTSAERWDDLQVLYRKRIEETLDAETKLELLSQLCFLFEEILDRPERAIETYEQILTIEPAHSVARRTLERLYERMQKYRELATLLTGNLDHASDKERGHERIDVMLKLGDLYEVKLGEPGSAVDQYEGVLADQPLHMRAQQALARLLSVSSQRQRIAEILAPLYETQGAYAELTNVLAIRLESLDTDADRAALSLRIGELHEHRTRDAEAALAAYAAAVEADPGLENARFALRDLAATRETFRQRRASVLRVAVDKISGKDPAVEGDVLLELAVLLDEYLGDQDGAARAYERLIELDPHNGDVVLIAARALERIHTARGDHAKLAVDLRRQVDFETDSASRGRLMARLATLLEETLSDAPGAVAVHLLRLEHDASDTGAMLALERLYEKQGQWRELVNVLEQHAEHSTDDAERRALTRRAGTLLDDKLSEPAAAIELCTDLLANLGPDRETLTLLAGLYERAEKHAELLDTLIELERFMTESAARAELQLKVAELLRTQLGDPQRSLGYYESVLQYDSQNILALTALESLMKSDDPEQVTRAARIAIPRYESASAFEKLITALLALEQAESDPGEKLSALRRASEVSENAVGDAGRAFEYMARAVRVGQQDPSLRSMAAELARLAETGQRFPQYVELLQEIVPEVYDAPLKAELYRRIAEAAEQKLSDPRLALAQYAKLLDEQPEDAAALSASIRINEQLGDHRALLELWSRKAELTKDPAERERIVFTRAALLENDIGDREGAVGVLEELILERPVPAAFSGLERLLTALGKNEELAALYEQQLDREVGSPLDARYKLAKLSLERLNDTPRAIDHLRDALTDDPNHGPSIDLLERVMEQPGESRPVAAEILESGYLARRQWKKLVAALEARVEGESDADERKRLLTRLGQLQEDQLEDFDAATTVYARLFAEDPTEDDTWETLGRLAKVSNKWQQLVDILAAPIESGGGEELARLAKHTGRIAVERLSAYERAAKLFAHALDSEPSDREAFVALEAAYRASQAWDKLLPLYRAQADTAEDDVARAALLHKLAEGQRELTRDRAAAIATYRELIELRSDDAQAVRALEALLVEAEDWKALADHLRDRMDVAAGTPDELLIKLRLAELLETKLNDTTGAIDVLEDVVRVAPRDKRAIQVLERLVAETEHTPRVTQILEPLYREQGEWRKLIAVLEAQVELSSDVEDRTRLLGEIGELHEQRGRDTGHALRAWSRALMVEPGNDAARAHVERLASGRGAWDELVAVYEAVLAKLDDNAIAATMLATLARVHDEKRGDPRSAIGAYERLATIDADDPAPLDALESLHLMVGDWGGLARVLLRRVDQAYSPQEKGELLRRLGSIHEEVLGDRAAAMAAYEKAVAEDDADALAYEALDRLYTREKRVPELVTLLGRRIELADSSEDRVNLGLRLGTLLDVSMRRLSDAVDTYRRVLDEDPTHVQALAALASLLEREGRFRELLDILAQQRSVAAIDAQRVAFSYRAGDILEKRLDEPEEAIERYAEALGTDKAHAPSIEALMRLGRSEQHRVRVREILEPLLREQERWDEVIALLEMGLPHIDDPHERRTELQRIAETHEGGRHDNAAAFAALKRALAEDPNDDTIADDLERLSRMIGDFAPLADVLGEQGSRAADPIAGARLYRRLARIAEQELRDDGRAIEAFVHASERDDDSIETLVDLDRLYEKTGRHEELRDIVERRVAVTMELAERSELLVRLGNLREQRFDDGRGALMAFREVLEGEPGNEAALAGLERLGHREALALEVLELLDECYRNTSSTAKLAGLYDLRIKLAQTDGERIRLLREAAIIWERDLNDPVRALAQLRRVFEIDPSDDDTLLAIESLATDTGSWESLRGLIEGLVTSSSIEGQRKKELCLRAAEWYQGKLSDPAAEERCVRWAIEVDLSDIELRERLVRLLDVPGRERDRAAALREQSEVESSSEQRKSLLRDAAALYEQAVSDLESAASCWASLLEADPQDGAALAELERIRTLQGRPRDVATLIERRLQLADGPEEENALRYRLAETQRALGDDAGAIATLRTLLARVPGHPAALDALDDMYTRAERHEDLRALLRSRLDAADDFETRTALRLRLAALAETRFADRADAIALFQAVLEESPGHATADPALERLYSAEGRTADRVQLLTQRADASRQRGDRAGEIGALRGAADLYERELKDLARAAHALEGVRELEPDDKKTLETLSRLYETLEQWGPATERLDELLNHETGDNALSIAHRIAGIAEAKLSDVALAEKALLRGHAMDRSHELTQRTLAALYERHGMHDKLAAWLSAQEPQVTDPTKKLSLLLRIANLQRSQLGDAAAAANTLERAIAIAPDDRDVLMQLCDLYIVAGRSKDAIPLLEKIVASYAGRRAKEVALYEHKLGQAYEGLGQSQDALKHYDAAFKVDLTSVPILRDLGRLCLATGDLERAQKTYRALLLQRLTPETGLTKADVYFRLGEISFKQGDKLKAKSMLERAVAEGGGHPEASALLAQC